MDDAYRIIPVSRLTKAQAVQCEALQLAVGPTNGRVPKRGGRAWLAVDGDDVVVGFACIHRTGRTVHIDNSVVAPSARGNGLQRRLFNAIIAWAYADRGRADVIRTYCDCTNWYSAANIVACGFQVDRIDNTGGCWVEWIRQ